MLKQNNKLKIKIWESWATPNWSKGSVGQEESRSQILSPRSSIPNTGFQVTDPRPQILNPKFWIPNPSSQIPSPKFTKNFVEFFLAKNNLGQKKVLAEKKFGSKKILAEKKFGCKKNLAEQKFGSKKIWPKKNWVKLPEKNFGQKKCGSKKI